MSVSETPEPRSLSEKLEPYVAIIGPMAMILAVLIFMGIVEPVRYFRLTNLNLILLDAALYLPMAMTFVITQRGIDLSIDSIAAHSGILMAFLIKQYGFSVYIAVPIAIMLGALMGLIITRFNVLDLIGTLAMDLVYRGLALVIAKGLVLARFPDLIKDIGRGQIPGFIPIPVVIGLATILGGYVLLKRSYFGRYTVAIGSNPEAAALTGIAVNRHKVYAYVLCGACAALAGVMLTGKLNAIQATSAPYFNLHVIAAVVVGGTSLFGGRASIVGSLAGVLLLSMMINALVTLRIEFFWQSVASGVVIVSSVALYTWMQKKDRDGSGGWLTALATPEGQRMLRFSALIIGSLIALIAIGGALAVDPTPSG